ncbi:MAG TPA: OmpH family outer membrane protein [Candidatus Kapabacteria bacterium]|nr:OmpH family outer membrane protein [Candidatus Kapabacteria bacterium]
MKKNIFLAIITIVLFSSSLFAQQKSNITIGIVDVEMIVKEIPEAVQADQFLRDYQKNSNDTLTKMQEDLYKKYEQYQKQKSMMTAEQQQKEEEAMKTMESNMMAYREQVYNNIQTKREEFLEPIRKKVKEAIESVAKEEKISLVLNKLNEAVLFSEDQLDITFKVLDRIKRGKK